MQMSVVCTLQLYLRLCAVCATDHVTASRIRLLTDVGLDKNFLREVPFYFVVKHYMQKQKQPVGLQLIFSKKQRDPNFICGVKYMTDSHISVYNHPAYFEHPIEGTPVNFVVNLTTLKVETFGYLSLIHI